MKKTFILFTLILIVGCSSNSKYKDNMKELDRVYGECDNPLKTLSKMQYEICKASERAGGETLFNLEEGFDQLFNEKNNQIVYSSKINQDLWSASISVTDNFPLKIADNNGGIIETDWIYDSADAQKRCLIKIKIVSPDLVSNGVSTNFICQNQNQDDIWITDSKDYSEEEKKLILKILQIASSINQSAS